MYSYAMWLRLISRHGNSGTVTIPSAIRQALGWGVGDFVRIEMGEKESVIMRRVDVKTLSDKQKGAMTPLQRINYGR